jgi:hypothetical protein
VWGYTVCTSVNICQSNQWNSAACMSQNFHHTLYISDYNIAYLGMEKGRVTLSVYQSTSVSQTNEILPHECRRISIIHCILVSPLVLVGSIHVFALYYIAYLGMENGGDTLSVRRSTSVSQTNGILWHECRRISIIHCILVTTI